MSNDWETQYHRLFEKLHETDTKWLQRFQSLSDKCRGVEEEKTRLAQQLKQSEEAVSELGEEVRQCHKKEDSYVQERMEMKSQVANLKTTLEEKKELFERVVKENHSEVRKLEEAAKSLRKTLRACEGKLERALGDVKRLNEERQGLLDTIRDMEEDKCKSNQIKIKSNVDVVLSKYLAAFPQDEEGLKIRFVDGVTNSHSFAFLLLMKLCHEDVLSNIRAASTIIPTRESMVDMVVQRQLFVEFCHYARIVQCKNANTFDEAMVASAKTKDMTRHTINYEEMELCNARQQFVLALLRVTAELPSHCMDKCNDMKSDDCKEGQSDFCMDDAMGFD